jgi:protein O-mannosyl-transferase
METRRTPGYATARGGGRTAPSVHAPSPARRAVVLRSAVLAVAAVVVHLTCLPNGFTQDDFLYVVRNQQARSAPWDLFFSQYGSSPIYRPVAMLTYAANLATTGDAPLGFHLVNLILHALVAVLLYILLRELLSAVAMPAGDPAARAAGHARVARARPPASFEVAFAAALLFAVHPIHSEAVAAVVGRSELLAAGFVFAAWLAHLRGRTLAASACFLLALLSKESAIVFPALVALGDVALRRKLRLSGYAWYAAALALFLLASWHAVGAPDPGQGSFLDNPLRELSAWSRVPAALGVALRYLALHLFPATLSADYSFEAIPVASSAGARIAVAAVAAALLAAWLWSFRRDRRVFLAGSLYVVGFAVTSNVAFPIGTIMGERLAYLPSAGFCLLAAILLERVALRREGAAMAILVAVAVALGVRTAVRDRDWQDNLTLFTAAVRAYPSNAKARHNLGVELLDRGDLAGARAELEEAYRIHPEYPDLLASLGVLAYRSGDKPGAARFMRAALDRSGLGNANYEDLLINYAGVLMELGNDAEALAWLDRLIAVSPGNARAYNARGILYLRRGSLDAARADLRRAIELEPRDQQARSLLAKLDAKPAAPSDGP